MIKKINFIYIIFFFYLFLNSILLADVQKEIVEKLEKTETLSFNFIQKIDGSEEKGNCYIKYPLLMRCDYKNVKQKILISNGRTLAIIKKKYKKIYYYPLKKTPLFIILDKKKILYLVKQNPPTNIYKNKIEFLFTDKKLNALKIFFDKNTLEFKGWTTKDAYSNEVIFTIVDLEINKMIEDKYFKIPKEENL